MIPGKIRRVVTAQGRGRDAHVSHDSDAPVVHSFADETHIMEIWKSGQAPHRMDCGQEEPVQGAMALHPPHGGSIFRIADIPPDDEVKSARDAHEMFEAMGAAEASTHGDADGSALMHRTPSIDYGIVLDGEIVLILDEEEVLLGQGDVVVQRGSNHGWSNRSGRMCRMAFVMISAEYAE